MILVKDEHNYFFQFPAFRRIGGLVHAVVSRIGGLSQPPYDGMNVSLGVGDDTAAVTANRRRLVDMANGIHVYTRQNHGTAIQVISRQSVSNGTPIHAEPLPADALITNVPGIRLLIQTADCQAVMLADSQAGVVANVHCGWRGSVADIIGKTVARMVSEFGCRPGRMIAAIGPSLGPCCAEFTNYKQEIPRQFWSFRTGRHHFDFWGISRHQLVKAGFAQHRIHTCGICSRCNPQLFFSYRAARQTGRFAALIGINNEIGTG